jgi:hypothetical protein
MAAGEVNIAAHPLEESERDSLDTALTAVLEDGKLTAQIFPAFLKEAKDKHKNNT